MKVILASIMMAAVLATQAGEKWGGFIARAMARPKKRTIQQKACNTRCRRKALYKRYHKCMK
jgi:hypothetical protein